MRALIRLLVWILIAALPLQGGAVAFMSCGADTAPSYSVEHHSGDAIAASQEEHCAQSGAEANAHIPHAKCSHCASCCVGAAAPPAVPSVMMPADLSSFAHPAVEPAMTAYIPATLERPPRRPS